MTIYFDIDEPVIVGSAYFEVRFFLLPANTQVGSTVVVSDNLQHTVDLSAGDYRMNVLYFNGVDDVGCDNKDVLFSVPEEAGVPCACGSANAAITNNCDGSYTLEVTTSGGSQCGHRLTYTPNVNTVPLSIVNFYGASMSIPFSVDSLDSYAKIEALCCDGSVITCFEQSGLTVNTCGDCPMPVISLNGAQWVTVSGSQYIEIDIAVTAGALPIYVHIKQPNELIVNGSPTEMPLPPFVAYDTSYVFNLAPSPLATGEVDFEVLVVSDNACMKDSNATGNVANTIITFTMPPL